MMAANAGGHFCKTVNIMFMDATNVCSVLYPQAITDQTGCFWYCVFETSEKRSGMEELAMPEQVARRRRMFISPVETVTSVIS
ncbi:hypothetical protein AOLI_G00042070 [Acnodon oligacanthus]